MSVEKALPPHAIVPTLSKSLSRAAYERSVETLTRYLAEYPKAAVAFHNRAVALYHLGRCEQALKDFDRSIECDPAKDYSYFLKAEIHREAGETESEIACYNLALENLTEKYYRWKAFCARARARGKTGEPLGAVGDYDAAIRLVPTLRKAYLERGAVLYRFGDRERGLADLKRATLNTNLEYLDWSPVADIIRAEPELQRSGCLLPLFYARQIVEAAGAPVDADDLPEAEKRRAIDENRLIVIYVTHSMGDSSAFYRTAGEESLRSPADGWLLFPQPIPENLRGAHHTGCEEAFEVHLLFRDCAAFW